MNSSHTWCFCCGLPRVICFCCCCCCCLVTVAPVVAAVAVALVGPLGVVAVALAGVAVVVLWVSGQQSTNFSNYLRAKHKSWQHLTMCCLCWRICIVCSWHSAWIARNSAGRIYSSKPTHKLCSAIKSTWKALEAEKGVKFVSIA